MEKDRAKREGNPFLSRVVQQTLTTLPQALRVKPVKRKTATLPWVSAKRVGATTGHGRTGVAIAVAGSGLARNSHDFLGNVFG